MCGSSERTCSVKSCARMLYTRGLCEPHYRRLKRTGTVNADTLLDSATVAPPVFDGPSIGGDLFIPFWEGCPKGGVGLRICIQRKLYITLPYYSQTSHNFY